MKYTLKETKKFQKDVRKCIKCGLPMEELKTVFKLLQETGKLPSRYHQHKLSGDYKDLWECHIRPDWLLIWKEFENELILVMTDTGTHSDLF